MLSKVVCMHRKCVLRSWTRLNRILKIHDNNKFVKRVIILCDLVELEFALKTVTPARELEQKCNDTLDCCSTGGSLTLAIPI